MAHVDTVSNISTFIGVAVDMLVSPVMWLDELLIDRDGRCLKGWPLLQDLNFPSGLDPFSFGSEPYIIATPVFVPSVRGLVPGPPSHIVCC